MKGEKFWHVSAFTGVGCKGNVHRVILFDTAIDIEKARIFSVEIEPVILVCIPLVEDSVGANLIVPRFFHNGREVMFCGSGCLSAAALLMDEIDAFKHLSQVSFMLQNRQVTVAKNSTKFAMMTRATLNAKRIRITLWEPVVKNHLIDAVELADGYVIAEVSSADEVQYLQPNLKLLKQMKQQRAPALIVTARSQDVGEDYVMRYFAPQYGNDEDAATGSANSYLMKYWQLKLNKKRLIGRQLSAQGGLFYGSVRGDNVTLSGKVNIKNA